ncbi:MAG: hypothetical protein KDA55_20760, partial [Planctomycetales bacterium]|nr:hypothetical protein [Planctomycetales bacterium]
GGNEVVYPLAGEAAISFGWPGMTAEAMRWLGPRLVVWPRGVIHERRVAIVSSRLGRELESQEDWFRRLRMACQRLDPATDVLLIVEETAAARFVERAAELFGLRCLRFALPDPQEMDWEAWLRRVGDATAEPGRSPAAQLSPPLWDSGNEDESLPPVARFPLRDRVQVAAADSLLALHVRRGGQLQQLLSARLDSRLWPAGSVFVALGTHHVSPAVANDLMDRGAVGWLVMGHDYDVSDELHDGTEPKNDDGPATAISQFVASTRQWPYLTHCTRRRDGPWPDQSDDEFLDDLLLERPERDHSPLAALTRILAEQRIIASSAGIRGGYRMVSFTAAPIAELDSLRVFRPHRARWDFEPYGISLRREWLRSVGGRPVVYGDDSVWRELPPDQQPFFQKRFSRSVKSSSEIDWSIEQEWRHAGDVDLSQVPDDAAVVFVSTESEASQLRPISRWPVIVLQSDES